MPTRLGLSYYGETRRTAEGDQAVQRFWGTTEGFQTISPNAPDAYASLLDLMTPLGLRADNVLRKI